MAQSGTRSGDVTMQEAVSSSGRSLRPPISSSIDTMEAADVWMEDSLRRSAELGRELLERARRRDVDWWSTCIHSDRGMGVRPGEETPQEERPASLDEAFSTLSQFMHQTTELCERYHSRIPAQRRSIRETQHISRFHCAKLQRGPVRLPLRSSSATAPLQSSGRMQNARDVNFEVAPGTYRISAASPNYRTQRHLVHITPGQSVDLTFHV
ncbi:A-kinase-interacting protein 1 isoform X2 [Dendropsophus ebraccatus]|uniref:A-kinase-interacting protein 1 isoform X2 n=1 Tax=Dendropsophus ebraccatus TaxID=150705 RepID=UPI0038312A17